MAWQPRFPFLLLANIRIFILDYEVLGQAHIGRGIGANTCQYQWVGRPATNIDINM